MAEPELKGIMTLKCSVAHITGSASVLFDSHYSAMKRWNKNENKTQSLNALPKIIRQGYSWAEEYPVPYFFSLPGLQASLTRYLWPS